MRHAIIIGNTDGKANVVAIRDEAFPAVVRKIDNLVQIAHNVQVGDHTAMAACVGISGSTKIGKHCMIAGVDAANTGSIRFHERLGFGDLTVRSHRVRLDGRGLVGAPSPTSSVVSTESFMYLELWKQLYDWGTGPDGVPENESRTERTTKKRPRKTRRVSRYRTGPGTPGSPRRHSLRR